MALFIDNITTHGDSNTGNDTVPPGITGSDWCHMVTDNADQGALEIEAFLDAHPEIGQSSTNIRRKTVNDGLDGGSLITYVGLDPTMRDAAVAAIAADAAAACQKGRLFVLSHSFDAGPGSWEP